MTPRLSFSLAGRSLCIEATTTGALAAIEPAFAHLTSVPSIEARQTRWTILEEDDAWRPDTYGKPGAYRIRGGGFAVVQADPPSFESYRPNMGIELRAGRAALAAGDLRAHPACFSLAAWLNGPTTQVLHAGAIAYDGAAALIVGAGGVGKSTTALACAMAGADFLGDDLVLVDRGDGNDTTEPTVHCLFATAKLNADSARALGASAWPTLGVTPNSKTVVAVQHRLKVARSAPIVALIMLAPPVAGSPRPERLRTAVAMASLTPTVAPMMCRTGPSATWLATAAALARRIPAYRLPVSWELDRLGPAVREIVALALADRGRAANRGPNGAQRRDAG